MSVDLKIVENKQMIAPPKTSASLWDWVRNNLFNNWYNTILTFVAGFIIIGIAYNVLSWVLFEAQWTVITNNYRLFMVGRYPLSELWRIWSLLTIVSFMFGLCSGSFKGTILRLSGILAGIYLIHLLAPFTASSSKVWLAVQLAGLVIGFLIALKLPYNKRIAIIGWVITIPLVFFFIHGFGILPEVRTTFWNGLLLTVLLAGVAIILSFPLGVLLALGRTSKLPAIKYFCIGYIELIRAVPLITIFLMAQVLIPLFLPTGLTIDNLLRVMLGATLFTAAYAAENVRGGLQSIPNGQYEAAKAIGLNPFQTTFFIVLPQALRAIIPTIVGQSISMFKDTSLVAIVGLLDLLGIAQSVKSNPEFLGRHMEVYIYIAFVYWVIAYSMSYSSRRIEKSLGVGER
ncbi:general L-amino acid transport system permease protein [Amphibacillus marinus]|uniref:General L-amino acid transport system permease protein n=1 Tax=Amphibacillus marinus TaxID=872970 RepID=A0A1H8IEA4_9BACI|nr:amino acid ABC transporter permease [Amphibacillus marinus]SEN66572.1 general L-amino acid transport system permease protein [Amphibacillus marinus]